MRQEFAKWSGLSGGSLVNLMIGNEQGGRYDKSSCSAWWMILNLTTQIFLTSCNA